jgi:hypothetical protein
MTYSVLSTGSTTRTDNAFFTVQETGGASDSQSHVRQGGNAADNFSSGASGSFSQQDTVTDSSSSTDQDSSTYALSEGGGYGGQSWDLSSFNLSIQDGFTSTLHQVTTQSSAENGTFAANLVQGGSTVYDVTGRSRA